MPDTAGGSTASARRGPGALYWAASSLVLVAGLYATGMVVYGLARPGGGLAAMGVVAVVFEAVTCFAAVVLGVGLLWAGVGQWLGFRGQADPVDATQPDLAVTRWRRFRTAVGWVLLAWTVVTSGLYTAGLVSLGVYAVLVTPAAATVGWLVRDLHYGRSPRR